MAYGSTQKRNFKIAAEEQARIEQEVKGIVGKRGHLMFMHFYCSFGKKVVQLKKKYGGQQLLNELKILDDKWAARGLNALLLKEIKANYVPEYKIDLCQQLLDLVWAHQGEAATGCLTIIDFVSAGTIDFFDYVYVAARFGQKDWCKSVLWQYYDCVAKEKW